MELTSLVWSCDKREEDVYSNDTVDLIQYGLRNGGTQAEYDLATRLQEMRELAFSLAVELYISQGFVCNNEDLKLIDVMTEQRTMVRSFIKS